MLDPIRDFPWLRGAYEDGIEKGKAAGVSEGMAASILTVLTSRGVVVDDILRQRILKCQDQPRLRGWLARAATAKSAAEAVGDE